jgi:hypothetical protein
MKLVKLTQKPPDDKVSDFCIFNSFLDQDLIINENSQVALQSISFTLDQDDIVITADNQTINVTLINDGVTVNYDIYLLEGVYNRSNYQDFFNDFTFALNQGIPFTSNFLGTEFDCRLSRNESIFVMDYLRGDVGIKNLEFVNVDVDGVAYKNDTAPGSGESSFMFIRDKMCRGAGFWRVQNSNVDSNVSIGLMTRALNDNDTRINPNEVVFGLRLKLNTPGNETYEYILNGQATESAYNALQGDTMEIRINNGDLEIGFYRFNTTQFFNVVTNAGDLTKLENLFENGRNRSLYPFCQLIQNNSEITKPLFAATPYEDIISRNDFNASLADVTNYHTNLYAPEPNNNNDYTFIITFLDLELALICGFLRQEQTTVVLSGNQQDLRAVKKFDTALVNENFVVEMENMVLDAYSDQKKGRFSILSSFAVENDLNTYRYTAPYPTFLDIKNNNPLTLRNIRMRVLDGDLEPIETEGLSNAVLLFKDKDE